jgi:acetyl esterase/lipase
LRKECREKEFMPSRHLVDPELAPLLDYLPDMAPSDESLPAARAAAAEMVALHTADRDATVTITEHWAPGLNGEPDVRVVLYRPESLLQGAPVLLQVHGGGFVFGTAELGDPRNRAWAKALGCAVASVDYRLAPETPYPGGLEDCYAALVWLHGAAEELRLDPQRIALRGESAGGGLAAALAILARDRGGPPILFQLLVYPMLDDRTCSSEPHPYAGQFVWNPASNTYGWASWLGAAPGSSEISHLAAPSRCEDLSGLPPTCITTGALDLFVEEDLEYARRLIRAGVPTELYLAPGAFHGFDAMAPDAEVSRQFTEVSLKALARAFRSG